MFRGKRGKRGCDTWEEWGGGEPHLYILMLLGPPALPRCERRRVLAAHPPEPVPEVLLVLLEVEGERVEPERREQPGARDEPDRPRGAPVRAVAVRPVAERVEEEERPEELEAVVEVRARVEAVELGELLVAHHEAAAGRPVLCAAVLERRVEVVRLEGWGRGGVGVG